MSIRQLHEQISAEFEKAKTAYHNAKHDDFINMDEYCLLEGKYFAWSAAFELSYRAVHG